MSSRMESDHSACAEAHTQKLKHAHKFRTKVPTLVKDTFKLDRKNGNTFWANVIAAEMKTYGLHSRSCLIGLLHLMDTRKFCVK